MKQYGFNMATEFTKKQVNVIYALNKQGKLNVPDEAIKEFYNLADYYGYDYNRSITDREQIILLTLEAIFANDLEEAQRNIDLYKSLYLGMEECEEAEEAEGEETQETANKIFDEVPEGFKIDKGATTAPRGTNWYSNGKSRFKGERVQVLVRENVEVQI